MSCETCNGRQWILVNDGRAGTARRCPDCLPSVTQRLVSAGAWERFIGWTRDSWLAAGRAWPAETGSWPQAHPLLTLHGQTGTWKTTLATILLRECLERGERVLWLHVPSFIDEVFRRRSADDWDGANSLREQARCFQGTVLLDEMFARKASGVETTATEQETLQVIISYRDGRLLPTVTTTNVDLAALILDAPLLISRLLGGVTIELGGADQRLVAALAAGGAE